MASECESKDQPEFRSSGMSRNYFCSDCKWTTRNPRLYLEHRRDTHRESISIHACDLCIYASKHSQKLARHMRTVHRDIVQDITIQSYRNFNQSLESIPADFQSMQNSKNTRLSTCKLCGLFAISKTILIDHVRTQHPDIRIYECDKCDYSHYIRDRYNRHHRYHSMSQIQCKMCEFQTIYRWNLERHMRHHIDTISLGFRCNKCNFTASTKQSITAHEIAHHSGPQIECNQTTSTESLSNISNENDMQIEEKSDFDASAFLEVVMDDKSQHQFEHAVREFGDVAPTQQCTTEFSKPSFTQTTKSFFCLKCNFRNEIYLDSSAGETTTASAGILLSTPNSHYRCGYCQQTSNWKHVIERHCRLVHNSVAFIEKYSDQEKTFKLFTPNKRRVDSVNQTSTMVSSHKRAADDSSAIPFAVAASSWTPN